MLAKLTPTLRKDIVKNYAILDTRVELVTLARRLEVAERPVTAALTGVKRLGDGDYGRRDSNRGGDRKRSKSRYLRSERSR